MRVRRPIGLAVAMATLVAGPALVQPSATATPSLDPRAPATVEQRLRAASTGPVTIRRDGQGRAHFVGTAAGRPIARPAGLASSASPENAARGHLARYGALFGVRNQARDLRTKRVVGIGRGRSVVRFQQTVGGLPVLGGELTSVVDSDGDLLSVNGETSREVGSTSFRVTAEQAHRVAVASTSRGSRVPASRLSASVPRQWLYDASLVGPSRITGARPVWRVEVRATDGSPVRQLVLVDGNTGGVALSFNQVAHALDRQVCDFGNAVEEDNTCPHGSYVVRRAEGGAPSGVAEVDHAYDFSGATYDFYLNVLGRDGIDETTGMPVVSTVNYCAGDEDPDVPGCQFYNAYWDGLQMTYGTGFAAADDVVAHEYTHGVTQNTSELLYYYESGAINESLSDIFGEFVDLTDGAGDDRPEVRWGLGEDLPDGWIGGACDPALRNMADPPSCGQPARTSSTKWDSDWADAGGVHINSGVGNKAAYLMTDGGNFVGVDYQAVSGETEIDRIRKVARIYYHAQSLLTSGSDYRDLYNVLQQSCANLIGSGTPPVEAEDCTRVKAALDAVQMGQYPTRQAPLPSTPSRCPRGYVPSAIFSDPFDVDYLSTKWDVSGGDWSRNEYYQRPESPGMAAFGANPEDLADDGKGMSRSLAMRSFMTVPSGRPTYLRFSHAYAFDHFGPGYDVAPQYYDGGFLEVDVYGDGRGWQGLPVDRNGYHAAIEATRTTRSVRKGFGGDSTDWYTSRADLTPFAGKQIKLRYRIISDGWIASSAAYGWWLDDVEVNRCDGPSAPRSVTAVGGLGTAKLTWGPASPNGASTPITSYVVQRTGGPVRALPASARSGSFSGLPYGKTLSFTVKAVNQAGGVGPVVKRTLTGTSISLSGPKSVERGGWARFTGRLVKAGTTKGLSSQRVKVYVRKPGAATWTYLKAKTTEPGGYFGFGHTVTGSREFRVLFPSGSTGYLGGRSAVRKVTVT